MLSNELVFSSSYIQVAMLGLLWLTSLSIVFAKETIIIVILTNLFSFIIASIYLLLNAPDVAITEAAIGSCLTSIFLLSSIKQMNFSIEAIKPTKKIFNFICLIACLILAWYLICLSFCFPDFSQADAPIYSSSYNHYIQKSGSEIGINSVVASILASYRGYDTLGETAVILIAGLIVYFLLKGLVSNSKIMPKEKLLSATSYYLLPLALMIALYVQLNGESSPGGGFQAGAITASCLIAYQLFSSQNLELPTQQWLKYSAIGLLTYQLTGWLCVENNFLDYNGLLLPSFLNKQIWGIMLVEISIGITVVSVMMLIFQLLRSRQHVNKL